MQKLKLGVVSLLCVCAGPLQAATITVTDTMDVLAPLGSTCSLRDAIQSYNTLTAVGACTAADGDDSDVILVPAGAYGVDGVADDDANATGDLDLTGASALEIRGVPNSVTGVSGPTIIDAGGSDRVFDLLSGASITFTNLVIRNGHAPDSNGNPTAEDGGGIRSAGGGSISISGCTFARNSAGNTTQPEENAGHGGAIITNGPLTVSESVFSMNASGTANFGNGEGGEGGAIYATGDSLQTMNVVFVGNAAGPGSIAHGNGGAISFRNPSGTLNVSHSTFTANTSSSSGLPYLEVPNFGGAVFVDATTSTFISSTFNGNTAPSGGALYLRGGKTKVTNCTFFSNAVETSYYPYVIGQGGGILADQGVTGHIYSSTFFANVGGAVSGQGVETASQIDLLSNIIIGNVDADQNTPLDCGAPNFISIGHNLITANGGCTNSGDTLIETSDIEADLAGTLANLGGPTETLGLPVGSLALGAGSCANQNGPPNTLDQRDFPRGAVCDIGAVQVTGDGPLGEQGPSGAAGSQGAQGAAGADGTNGTAGTSGTNGVDGAAGPTGASGAAGTVGATGSAGATGAVGVVGATGAVGAAGTAGAKGGCRTTPDVSFFTLGFVLFALRLRRRSLLERLR